MGRVPEIVLRVLLDIIRAQAVRYGVLAGDMLNELQRLNDED